MSSRTIKWLIIALVIVPVAWVLARWIGFSLTVRQAERRLGPAYPSSVSTAPSKPRSKLDNDLCKAINAGDFDKAEALLKQGADINVRNDNSETYLYGADDPAFAKWLLDHGADPNAPGNAGMTPLLVAVLSDRLDRMKLLLEHGANPNVKNAWGASPLSKASEPNRSRTSKNASRIAALLRAAGAKE